MVGPVGPAGHTPEFTFSILVFFTILQQLVIFLVPVAVLVILIKINKKLDSMIELLRAIKKDDILGDRPEDTPLN